jgi:hypothetical protein
MADFASDGVFKFGAANGVTMRSYGYGFPALRNVANLLLAPERQAPLQGLLYPSVRPIKRHLAGLFTPTVFSILSYQGFIQTSFATGSRDRGVRAMSNPKVLILRGSQENPIMGGSSGGGGSTRPASGLVYPRLVK